MQDCTPITSRLKRIVATLVFLIVLVVLLTVLSALMPPPSSKKLDWMAYDARQKNSIDVVFVGNSHAECTVAPMQLWSQRSITSWSLHSGGINWPVKSAFVHQALSIHKPQLLTVEVYRVDAPVVSTMRRLTPALAALPFGASKIATAIDAAESGSQVEQLLIPLKSGHASYADFSRGRVAGAISLLSKVRAETSRAGGRILSEPPAVPDGDSADRQGAIDDSADIEDNLVYMRRIADECEKRGVPLLFWLAPIDGDPVQSQLFARVQAQLQLEYPEVQYLDMNSYTEEIGLISSDFRDEGHLYVWGAEKATEWLGSYLVNAGMVEARPTQAEASGGIVAQHNGLVMSMLLCENRVFGGRVDIPTSARMGECFRPFGESDSPCAIS